VQKIVHRTHPLDASLNAGHPADSILEGIEKRASGGTVSTTVLKRQSAKGQLSFSSTHWMLPKDILNQKVKLAYEDYFMIKAQENRRDTWLSQLIEATSQAKDIPKT